MSIKAISILCGSLALASCATVRMERLSNGDKMLYHKGGARTYVHSSGARISIPKGVWLPGGTIPDTMRDTIALRRDLDAINRTQCRSEVTFAPYC